jgi:hypothetical protein
MNNVRFQAGSPEKTGGWTEFNPSQLTGVPRSMLDWNDYSFNTYLAVGTNQKLYLVTDTTETDITPWRVIKTGTMTNTLTTTMGSSVVTVAQTAHGLSTGDYVQLTSSTGIDGITVANTFFITKTGSNSYTFNVAPQTGAAGVSGGGGTITYNYYRIITSASVATVSGSNIATIALTANGANVGDYVNITGMTAYEGITLNGFYQIQTVSANTFTVIAPNAATGTGSGGGGAGISLQFQISVGTVDTVLSGYGIGGYGDGGYGNATQTQSIYPGRIWFLDHYGQQLIAAPYGGTLYIWDPVIGGVAYPMYGAPASVLAMFITNERYIFALGTSGNPMQIQWPDQASYNNWTSSASDTAQTNTLQKGSFLVGGFVVRDGLALVSTNSAMLQFQYAGDNYVYNESTSALGAGMAGPFAGAQFGGTAYWMGRTDFWTWNGSTQKLPTDDIRKYVFGNINMQQAFKFHAVPIVSKNEIWFYYCSATSNEIDSYVIYHIDQGCFSIGQRGKTAMLDQNLFNNPLGSDATGFVYNEETGTDANGTALDAYVVYSPTDVSKGDRNMDIGSFIPDFQRLAGTVNLTVNIQHYPQSPVSAYGPFPIQPDGSTPIIDLRVGAKLVGFKLESNVVGGDFRIGQSRADVYPAGARR